MGKLEAVGLSRFQDLTGLRIEGADGSLVDDLPSISAGSIAYWRCRSRCKTRSSTSSSPWLKRGSRGVGFALMSRLGADGRSAGLAIRSMCHDQNDPVEQARPAPQCSQSWGPAALLCALTLALVLAGHETLAAKWMHHEMGAFLDEFFSVLPGELHEALGDRIGDLRPRWAIGTSRLVARMLSKHIDEFADRDLSLAMGR